MRTRAYPHILHALAAGVDSPTLHAGWRLPRGWLGEDQCVAHLVCARERAGEVESLAFEQAPGSGVAGTGDCGEAADSRHRCKAADEGGHGGGADALAPRGRGEGIADLDTSLAVGRAVGADIADDLGVSAADDEPDGRQDGGRAGVEVAKGDTHGLRDPVVQGSFFKCVHDLPAVEHAVSDAAGDRLNRHASGLDGPAALPVSGIRNSWLCDVRFPFPVPALRTDPNQPHSHASPAPAMTHSPAAGGVGLGVAPGPWPGIGKKGASFELLADGPWAEAVMGLILYGAGSRWGVRRPGWRRR